MKKILLALLLLLPLSNIFADNSRGQLIIKKKNGDDYSIYFSDRPTIYFEGNQMKVSCNSVSIMFRFSEITGYHFKNVMTDIERTESDNIFSQHGETIIVNTGKANDKVSVYDAAGAVVLSSTTDSQGKASISLTSLPTGVFVVNCNNNSFKITKQ